MVKKKLIKKEKLFEKKILKEKLCGLQLTYPFIDLQDPNLYLKRQLFSFHVNVLLHFFIQRGGHNRHVLVQTTKCMHLTLKIDQR